VLLPTTTTTGTIRTAVVFLSAADDLAPSSCVDRLSIMLTHDIARAMLVPTTNQKKTATSSSLKIIKEVEEKGLCCQTRWLPTGIEPGTCDDW